MSIAETVTSKPVSAFLVSISAHRTHVELQVGIAKSIAPAKRTQQLQQFLSRVSLVPFDQDAALAAAMIRASLEQQGTPIGQIDVLIAGTAIALQATLVTHNINEFSRVAALPIADWY